MTVCTASIFFWTYGPDFKDIDKVGAAIVAAADRKLTDLGLGIGYEASKWKGAGFGNRQLALVAGDIVVHSEVVRRLNSELLLSSISTTFDTAERAARIFRNYRMQEAARKFLAPINLDENSFLTQQRSMDPNLVIELTKQMQEYNIEAEILILGCDGKKDASIYRIDEFGVLTNHSDIGFVSIGSGGIHSSAHFMLLPYNHVVSYFPALYHTFKAKKRAEADPHVGTYTDMFLITKEGSFPIAPIPLTKD